MKEQENHLKAVCAVCSCVRLSSLCVCVAAVATATTIYVVTLQGAKRNELNLCQYTTERKTL